MINKSSAVAKMGDSLAIDMGGKVGAAVPLFGEIGGPSNNAAWTEAYTSVPSGILIHPAMATIDMGQMQVG